MRSEARITRDGPPPNRFPKSRRSEEFDTGSTRLAAQSKAVEDGKAVPQAATRGMSRADALASPPESVEETVQRSGIQSDSSGAERSRISRRPCPAIPASCSVSVGHQKNLQRLTSNSRLANVLCRVNLAPSALPSYLEPIFAAWQADEYPRSGLKYRAMQLYTFRSR